MKLQRIVVCVEPYAEKESESLTYRNVTKFTVRAKVEDESGEETELVLHHTVAEVEIRTPDFDTAFDYMLRMAGAQIKDIIKRKSGQ